MGEHLLLFTLLYILQTGTERPIVEWGCVLGVVGGGVWSGGAAEGAEGPEPVTYVTSAVILDIGLSTVGIYQFDLCDIIDCGGNPVGWKNWEVYLCMDFKINDCYAVSKMSFTRLSSPTENPLLLSLHGVQSSLHDGNASTMHIVLGVEASGGDPLKVIQINLLTPLNNKSEDETFSEQGNDNNSGFLDKETGGVLTFDSSKLTPADVIMLTTGYTGTNLWLDWLTATVRQYRMSNCVACAAGRPRMYTEPAPLILSDIWGFNCMLNMTKFKQPSGCDTLTTLFPLINSRTRMVPAIPVKDHYVCFNFTAGNRSVGRISESWCNITLPGHLIGTWARDGIFYLCGGNKLIGRRETGMTGVCAMVRLRAHVIMVGEQQPLNNRVKRSTFDFTTNSPTYIDSIRVPQGVPDQYKLVDQVAPGFESIFLRITPNKNVNRINYIHYNFLRLTNFTRDAIEGLSEQLAPTSLITLQNRMAVDMLLALEGLKALSKTMHEQSGVSNPLDKLFADLFGKYKDIVISLLVSAATFLAFLITCGCCCVPCLRSLAVRCIASTIEKGSESDVKPPAYQMYRLAGAPGKDV
uniref:Uncharacterized protein n=1 Tax=Xiphophorus couchianus TaxID=32473 RepID=A0A3B5LDJ7_9TELE